MAVKAKIRVKLKSYDNTLIDAAAEKIVKLLPVPLKKQSLNALRAKIGQEKNTLQKPVALIILMAMITQ